MGAFVGMNDGMQLVSDIYDIVRLKWYYRLVLQIETLFWIENPPQAAISQEFEV